MNIGEVFDSQWDCLDYDLCADEGRPSPDDCLLCRDINTGQTYNVVVRDKEGRVFWRSFPGTNVAFDLRYRAQLEAEGLTILYHGMPDDEASTIVLDHLTPDDVIAAATAPAMGEDGRIAPGLEEFARQNAFYALALTGHRPVTLLGGAEPTPLMIEGGEL